MVAARHGSGVVVLVATIVCAAFGFAHAAAPDGGTWHAFGGLPEGCDGPIYAAALAPNGDLYVGGNFTICGDVPAYAIARWNGSGWSAVGDNLGAGTINAIAIDGNDIFVGGYIGSAGGTSTSGVARWDGSTWSALGNGITGPEGAYDVNAIVVQGDDVYFGGHFNLAGSVPSNSIAHWNRSAQTWVSLGAVGITQDGELGTVRALSVFQGQLVVAGAFDHAGFVATPSIAIWDGGIWAGAGTGLENRTINALAVRNGVLFAGGALHSTDDPPEPDIGTLAQWDGNVWSELSVVPTAEVLALAPSLAGVYVGGTFTSPFGGIALWSGSAWSSAGGAIAAAPPTAGVHALAAGLSLFAGGEFAKVGDDTVVAHSIAAWNGTSWSALHAPGDNHGLFAPPFGAAAYADSICFGGPDLLPLGDIACWNGIAWTALGGDSANDLPGIRQLQTQGTDLYAIGYFTIDGSCVARWDGSAWHAVGSGLTGFPIAMTVDGPDVYVSGYFFSGPGTGVAHWDGSTWHLLGGQFVSLPRALAMYEGKLYATGYFTDAGGVPASRIAAWDGTSWSALGSGLSSGYGAALAVSRGSLYAGGYFAQAGGVEASSLARWDGTQWSAVTTPSGNGVGYTTYRGSVASLVDSSLGLIVAGSFDSAGGTPANSIARFDGSEFHALGTDSNNGVDTFVYSMVVEGTDIYIGGQFNRAGGFVSAKVARFEMDDAIFRDGFD